MKLLIIEDNHWLAESLQRYLQQYFVVDTALTAADGLQKISAIDYTAIVLDLNLPDGSGYTLCTNLRKRGVFTPILVLTGTKDPASCVKLLEAGADDYLTKPFNRSELRARLMALSRRQPTNSGTELVVGDLKIDIQSRRVVRSGVDIPLRRKEFDILEYLVSNRGRVVTRQMILNHAWSGNKDHWNNTVDVHIKYLRDKVDRPFAVPLIKTAHGIGYMVDGAKE